MEVLEVVYRITPAASLVGALIFAALMYRMKAEYASKADIERVQRRVEALEVAVKGIPDVASLNSINLTIEELRGDIKVLTATTSSLDRTVSRTDEALTRVEEYLLNRSAR